MMLVRLRVDDHIPVETGARSMNRPNSPQPFLCRLVLGRLFLVFRIQAGSGSLGPCSPLTYC